jgi:taurine dioxygenase
MTLAITSVGESLGAVATGVDMRAPEADDAATLMAALDEHIVLCIREQNLSPPEFLAAAALLGRPIPQINGYNTLPDHPEIGIISTDITDVHGSGEARIQGLTWHTDHSFIASPPRATILYGIDIPGTGGDTSFCDMRAAYAALPAEVKARIDDLNAVHCYQSSRSAVPMLTRTDEEAAKTPDVVHPLVLSHPRTGAKALYMSTTRLERIEGMARAESDALIDELFAHATQPCYQYHHKWRAGDMVIWDNLCSMHHANGGLPTGAKRYLHRALLANEATL